MYRAALLCLLTVTAQAAVSERTTDLTLQVRLQTHLTSYSSRPGSPFQCVVICPLEENGEVLIPAGSIVYGTVTRALPVRLGLGRERAGLELAFSSYKTPAGERFPLAAKLVAIDNAREEVTRKGQIKGVLAAENPDEVLNGIWAKPALNTFCRPLEGVMGVGHEILEKCPMTPIGPAVILGLRCLILRFPEPEIHLPPGTDMDLAVNRLSTGFAPQPAVAVPDASAALTKWLDSRPVDVEKPRGGPAEDVVNVAFLGSRQELFNAFSASGWYVAQRTSFHAFTHFYIAFNGKKTFATAPVSKLLYQGRAPDVTFEKSLDTVSKRHHVRIWSAGTFEGREIWLGAATHDTGVRFDSRTFFFTHRIDKNVDAERAKVSVDLGFAGCANEFISAPREEHSPVLTDGRIAVLSLQPCAARDLDAGPAPRPPGNKVTRLVRRVILETRSYIVRDNAYYWTYQAIRYTWQTRRVESAALKQSPPAHGGRASTEALRPQ